MKVTLNNISARENRIREEFKKRVYFCPYCRVLFKDDKWCKVVSKDPKQYQCLECKKDPFNEQTFHRLAKSKMKLHLNGTTDIITVEKYLTKIITPLLQKGYSNREIHRITFLPLYRINKLAKAIRQDPRVYTLSDFLQTEINLNKRELEYIINKVGIDTGLQDECIIKLFVYGCSYNFVAQLVTIDRNRLAIIKLNHETTMSKEELLSLESLRLKRSIKLNDKKEVTITYK